MQPVTQGAESNYATRSTLVFKLRKKIVIFNGKI